MTVYCSRGPALLLGLARENAVAHMQSILGVFGQSQAMKQQPDSLRARFAIEKNSVNSLHASANQESAERELQMFFPVEATMIAIKPNRTARAQKSELYLIICMKFAMKNNLLRRDF